MYLVSLQVLLGIHKSYQIYNSAMTSCSFGVTLILLPIVFHLILKVTKKPSANIVEHRNCLDRMSMVLHTALINSLPKRFIPILLKNQKMPCEIAENITCVYIHIKNEEDVLKSPESVQAKAYISRMHYFLSICDFLAEACSVQKIKSSYTYYMACCGAKQHFTGEQRGEALSQM